MLSAEIFNQHATVSVNVFLGLWKQQDLQTPDDIQ